MTVDPAALAIDMQEAIPLVGHLQLKVTELGPGHGTALLPDLEQQGDRGGAQHAGALFAVGEVAAHAACAATFAELVDGLAGRATGAEVRFGAAAHGPITATAALAGDPAEHVAALERDGRVEVTVDVVLHDAREQEVASLWVSWQVGAEVVA